MALVGVAVGHWFDFDGWCLARGVDAAALPISRAVHLVWAWIFRDTRPEDMGEASARWWQTISPRGAAHPARSPFALRRVE